MQRQAFLITEYQRGGGYIALRGIGQRGMNEDFFLSFMLKEGIIDTFKFKSLILIKKKSYYISTT